MEDVLCGISAFNYYRTPPQVLMLLPGFPYSRDASTRSTLYRHALVENSLHTPLEFLVFNKNSLHGSKVKNLSYRLWTKDLPKHAIRESEWAHSITSPALTLFTMARDLPLYRLAMAMYEMCGGFAVYRPSDQLEAQLQQSESDARLPRDFGWRRVMDSRGSGTDLWQRRPLTSMKELRELADETQSLHGQKKFVDALRCVTGMCLSPFEAQLSMLLGAPRGAGGQGLSIENNKKIALSKHARKIAGKQSCYVDLCLTSPDGSKMLAIECQGAVARESNDAVMADADRTTALQSMGIEVMLLTHKQILSPDRFNAVLASIAQTLDLRILPKTQRQRQKEQLLRREIFSDWSVLTG